MDEQEQLFETAQAQTDSTATDAAETGLQADAVLNIMPAISTAAPDAPYPNPVPSGAINALLDTIDTMVGRNTGDEVRDTVRDCTRRLRDMIV